MRRLLIRSWFGMSCDLVWTWMCLGVIYIYILSYVSYCCLIMSGLVWAELKMQSCLHRRMVAIVRSWLKIAAAPVPRELPLRTASIVASWLQV